MKPGRSIPEQHLSVVVAPRPFLTELRAGAVSIDGVILDFDNSYEPITRAFRPMVTNQSFDACEMAIGTYLQARAFGRPVTALPVALNGRFQHEQLRWDSSRPRPDPAKLDGTRVGLRSYTQTTGIWVRQFLREQFGVPLDSIQWVVTEEPHETRFAVPGNVEAAPAGQSLVSLLQAGELEAIIGGNGGEAAVQPALEHPGITAQSWYVQYGLPPVNHVLTVRSDLVAERPDAARSVYEAFAGAVSNRERNTIASSGPEWEWAQGVDLLPTGASLLDVLDMMADELHRQGLTPTRLERVHLLDAAVLDWVG